MEQSRAVVALFDVDGTLLRTEGPSRHTRALKAAFRKVYGVDCRFSTGMFGMTDLQILRVIAEEMNVGNGRALELGREACSEMVHIYSVPEETDGTYVILPGVRALLEVLRERGVALGLVTGNVPEIARHKLETIGLAEFFSFGAFGSEGDERAMLPPLAVSRAEAIIGRKTEPSRVYVIGDTPRDVAAAVLNGYRSIAVATGHLSVQELKETAAELVLKDLTDPEPVLQAMGLSVAPKID